MDFSLVMIQVEPPSNPFHAPRMCKRYKLTALDGALLKDEATVREAGTNWPLFSPVIRSPTNNRS